MALRGARPRTSATTSATRVTQAGSLRFPRWGTGARNGLSVSISSRSSGTNLRHVAQRRGLRKRDDAGQRHVEARGPAPRRANATSPVIAVEHPPAARPAPRRRSRPRRRRRPRARGSRPAGRRSPRQRQLLARTRPAARREARSRSGNRDRSRQSPAPSARTSRRAADGPAAALPGRPEPGRLVRVHADAEAQRRARGARKRRGPARTPRRWTRRGCTAPPTARRRARGPPRRRRPSRTPRRRGGSASRSSATAPGCPAAGPAASNATSSGLPALGARRQHHAVGLDAHQLRGLRGSRR